MSTAMNTYWGTFAKSGDPNWQGAPATWPKFAPEAPGGDQRLQLDPEWKTAADFRKADCEFWRGISEQAE